MSFLSFINLFLVCCSVGEAAAVPLSNGQRTLVYVFGSEAIYIIDPESKAVSSKIAADGVCTKSNNRFSR